MKSSAIERRGKLRRLEMLRGSQVIVYIAYAPLDDNLLIPLYNQLSKLDQGKPIDLFLFSYGGSVDAPHRIVTLIREYTYKLGVIIPSVAKSAASMIALGSDEIVMGPLSELGPIDPLVQHPNYKNLWVPIQSIRYCVDFAQKTLEHYSDSKTIIKVLEPLLDKLDPWLIGDYEKAIRASEQYAQHLLRQYMFKDDPEKASEVTRTMIDGYFSHGYSINRDEAETKLGLKIVRPSEDMWDLIWSLFLDYIDLMDEQGLSSILDINRSNGEGSLFGLKEKRI